MCAYGMHALRAILLSMYTAEGKCSVETQEETSININVVYIEYLEKI